MTQKLVAIVGPTAVGKTKYSIGLAKALQAEIISGDSMQVYKGMDIGTAKITAAEMENIPHHLIDILSPNEVFNAAKFKDLAEEAITTIHQHGHIPMLVGGSGMYVNGLLYDYQFSEVQTNQAIREKIEKEIETKGLEAVHAHLMAVDPGSEGSIFPNDKKRIIRALEVYELTGKPYSEDQKMKTRYDSAYDLAYIGLTMDRAHLYERINLRVDLMVEQGLVDEVKALLALGFHPDCVALQGIGYKEIIMALKGEMSLDESIELIKKKTRNFAKRQLTWFRRDPNIHWVDLETESEASHLEEMLNICEQCFH